MVLKLKPSSTKALLIATAFLEIGTGLGLIGVPSWLALLLLGATLDAPAGLVVARIAGAGLISLGLACWLTRNEGGRPAGYNLLKAMLFYNAAAAAVLLYARVGYAFTGIALIPAAILHAALAVWCMGSLRSL